MNEQRIDIDSLLTPVSAQQPVGEDLRQISPAYHSLKALRAKVRADERRLAVSDEVVETILADWRKIEKHSQQILRTESKDLDVAVWLTEALLRLYGFAGLNDGFTLLYKLISQFWPELYPVPTGDEEPHQRFAALAGLNGVGNPGAIIAAIYCTPLFAQSGKIINTWHYQQAAQAESDQGEHLAAIEAAARLSGRDALEATRQKLKECIETFDDLCRILKEKSAPDDPPPSSHIRNALQTCCGIVDNLLTNFADEKTAALDQTPVDTSTDAKHQKLPTPDIEKTPITSREAAFASLTKLVAYFHAAEPCSPVGYLLEKALSWRNVRLPELLVDLIEDPQSLQMSFRSLGIRISSHELVSNHGDEKFDEYEE